MSVMKPSSGSFNAREATTRTAMPSRALNGLRKYVIIMRRAAAM